MRAFLARLLPAAVVLLLGSGAVAEAPRGETRLLEPGAEPRAPLRYDLAAFRPASAAVEMDTDSEVSGAALPGGSMSQVMPRMRMQMHCEDMEMTEEGRLRMAIRTGEMTAHSRPGVEEAMVQALSSAFATMGTMRGEVIIDERGRQWETSMDLSGIDPAMRRQMESQLEGVQDSLSAVFPEEPVGIGARWEVLTELATAEMTIEDRTVLTLVERTEDSATMTFTSTQSGTISGPGGGAIGGRGEGRMVTNFTSPVPAAEMNINMRMQMNDPQAGEMDITTKMKLTMRPDP